MDLVADMLFQGATAEEILEGYPTLNKEKLAILLVSRQLMSITLSQPELRKQIETLRHNPRHNNPSNFPSVVSS
jgi:hypothetical protein